MILWFVFGRGSSLVTSSNIGVSIFEQQQQQQQHKTK